jgi:hypothetical protein
VRPSPPDLTPLEFVALGLAVPLLPRIAHTLADSSPEATFGAWGTSLESALRGAPGSFLGEWALVLVPFLVLAFGAVLLLRTGDEGLRRERRTGLWIAAGITVMFGLFACRPVDGMGYGFHLGEALFPLVATPALPLLYGFGVLIAPSGPSPTDQADR